MTHRGGGLRLALCAALLAVGLAACGGDDEGGASSAGNSEVSAENWTLKAAAEPYRGTEIRILDEITDLQPAFAELIPVFEKETGIQVSYELEGHLDVIRKGEADLLSGRGAYDAVMIHSTQKGRVVAADAVMPIDEFLANESLKDPNVNFEDFIQPLADETTLYGDTRLAFPIWNYNNIWWGRGDLMEHPDEQEAFQERYGRELEPPATLQEMRDIAEFFTRDAGEELAGETLERPFAGFVKEGAQAGSAFEEVRYNFMHQFGGDLWDEQGNPTADSPENVEAMRFYADLWQFAPDGQAEMSLIDIPVIMGEGRAASGLIWSDFVFSVDKEGGSRHAGEFVYAGVPANAEGGDRRAAAEPSMIVISQASENPEATFLFLQWMVSKEAQDLWFETGVGMPVREDSLEHPTVTEGERAQYYEAVADSLSNGTAWPVAPSLFEVVDEVNVMQQRVGQGDQSPEDAMRELQDRLLDICGGSCIVPPDEG